MDKFFRIEYTDGVEDYVTTANSQEEAEIVKAQLYDDGYQDIKTITIRT